MRRVVSSCAATAKYQSNSSGNQRAQPIAQEGRSAGKPATRPLALRWA